MRLALRHRPFTVAAVIAGLTIGIAARQVVPLHNALLLGWCGFVLCYAVPTWIRMRRATPAQIKRRAELVDEGEGAVLVASLASALASLGAVGWSIAAHRGAGTSMGIGLPLATIFLSWSFVHLLFTVRYAHEYWQADGGLDFAGGDRPSFDDFLYFAFTIGMTAQTSDTAVTTTPMRRLTLIHALVSFVFNAAILAAAVNVAASLVG
jgi:uncharacterized membrane protein